MEVKASENCLAQAILIAIANVEIDPIYTSYRDGSKKRPAVRKLLDKTGIQLSGGGGFPELLKFQEYVREYKMTVYRYLACEDIIFEGQVDSPKRINLHYDDVERQYHVIVNITGAMSKMYVCKACKKGGRRDITHICDQTFNDCMANPVRLLRYQNSLLRI